VHVLPRLPDFELLYVDRDGTELFDESTNEYPYDSRLFCPDTACFSRDAQSCTLFPEQIWLQATADMSVLLCWPSFD
jgi:hypothetical protein